MGSGILLVSACGDTGSAAGGGSGDATPPVQVVDTAADTVVTTASGLLAQVSDLGVMHDGTVVVVDRGANAVHLLSSDGAHLRTLGRMGAGPGEFSSPSSLGLRGDTLLVVDSRNGRLQRISLEEVPLDSRPLPPGYPPSVAPGGWLVVPTLGRDSILARVHGADGTPGAPLGESADAFSGVIRLSDLKEEIQQGGLPVIFRNTAYLRAVGDSTIWLLLPAWGLVERYGLSGTRHAEVTLDDPGFPAVRAEFMERNASAEPMEMVPLDLLLDARPVGEELWVLLGRPAGEGARVAVLSPAGEVRRIVDFPGVMGAQFFLPDRDRSGVWFVIQDTAEVLRVPLETWPGAG